MTYVIECRNPYNEESVDFTGPFDSRSDAEIFLMLPLPGGILHCQRTHTIHELIVPHAESLNLSQVLRIVNEAKYDAKRDATVELARRSRPFVEHWEGPMGTKIESKIATIKEMRNRFDGLGLKEAKDIVDEWERNGDVSFTGN